jgi:AAA domain
MSDPVDFFTDEQSRPTDLLAGLHNGEWLDAQDFPPLRYAIPGLVPEGLSLIVGAPKIGKSWWALNTCLAAASGGVALGHIWVGQPRPVLYLALEDSDRRLQSRCRQLLGDEAIPPRFEYLTRIGSPGEIISTLTAWLGRHEGEQPFVIVDTLGKVMPLALQGELPARLSNHLRTQAAQRRRTRLRHRHQPSRPQGRIGRLRRPRLRDQRTGGWRRHHLGPVSRSQQAGRAAAGHRPGRSGGGVRTHVHPWRSVAARWG